MRFAAYVLAGGKSRRFGSDKALAELDGVPLIQRLIRALEPLCAVPIVVADREAKYAALGLTTIADVVPERGPLGGVLTALDHAHAHGESWCLVVTCDLVVFEPHWVDALAAARSAGVGAADRSAGSAGAAGGGADGAGAVSGRAVAFRDARWQPFPGLYHESLRGEVREAVMHDRLAMGRFLDAVGATALPLPADWPELVQANTRAELERLR